MARQQVHLLPRNGSLEVGHEEGAIAFGDGGYVDVSGVAQALRGGAEVVLAVTSVTSTSAQGMREGIECLFSGYDKARRSWGECEPVFEETYNWFHHRLMDKHFSSYFHPLVGKFLESIRVSKMELNTRESRIFGVKGGKKVTLFQINVLVFLVDVIFPDSSAYATLVEEVVALLVANADNIHVQEILRHLLPHRYST